MISDSLPAPLHPEVGVLGFVPDTWGDVWMPRHHIMSRLARYFNVLWLDPMRSWRDPRESDSLALNPGVPSFPGFRVMRSSRSIPNVHRPSFVRNLARRIHLLTAVRRLRAVGANRIVLYLWRPKFEYSLDDVAHSLSCYHVDDEYSFSATERPIGRQEMCVLQRVNCVFLHSPGLWEKKAKYAAHPVPLPNGVDFAAYSTPAPEPADLRDIPHPRIGYIGVLKRFLDIPLLLDVAVRRPDYSFVFVGPVKDLGREEESFRHLVARPNVHMLGPRPVESLPAYAQHSDVGILPYQVDGYTKFIFPLKLHEYLAAGIPAVGTRIRTLQAFEGVISLASGPAEWCAALEQGVLSASRAESRVTERRMVASAFDWDIQAHRVAGSIAEGLGLADTSAVFSEGVRPWRRAGSSEVIPSEFGPREMPG